MRRRAETVGTAAAFAPGGGYSITDGGLGTDCGTGSAVAGLGAVALGSGLGHKKNFAPCHASTVAATSQAQPARTGLRCTFRPVTLRQCGLQARGHHSHLGNLSCRLCGGSGCGGCGGAGFGDPCSGCGGRVMARVLCGACGGCGLFKHGYGGTGYGLWAARAAEHSMASGKGSAARRCRTNKVDYFVGAWRAGAPDPRLCALHRHNPIASRFLCLPANESQRSLTIYILEGSSRPRGPARAPGLVLPVSNLLARMAAAQDYRRVVRCKSGSRKQSEGRSGRAPGSSSSVSRASGSMAADRGLAARYRRAGPVPAAPGSRIQERSGLLMRFAGMPEQLPPDPCATISTTPVMPIAG